MWNKLIVKTIVLTVLMSTSDLYAQRLDARLKPLKQLLGDWEMSTPGSRIIESWTYLNRKSFQGKSVKVNSNGDTTLLEQIKIQVKDGKLRYIPVVEGQNSGKPVAFTLVSAKSGKYVFENKLHDFPQRIVYWFKSENDLFAWIEGEKNGKPRRAEFRYRRVP